MDAFQFRHRAIIPPTLLNWWVQGKISDMEMKLLAIIDAYDNEEGVCFASNRYIAEVLKVSVSRVQQIIRKLKKMDLIIYRYEETTQQRILESVWKDLPRHISTGGMEPHSTGGMEPHSIRNDFPLKGKSKRNINPSGSAVRNPLPVSDSLGLIDPEGIPSQDEISLPLKWAKEYKEGLRACWPSALASNDWRIANQAKEFAILLKHESAIRIDTVLQWFIDHNMGRGGQDGLPNRCKSPASFRKCWDWICEKFDAQVQSETSPIPDDELARFRNTLDLDKMDDLAGSIAEQLELDWPQRARDRFTDFVTLTAYRYLRFLVWAKTHEKVFWQYRDHLPDVEDFVFDWCKRANNMVKKWSEWKGNLANLDLALNDPPFQSMLARWMDWSKRDVEQVINRYFADTDWSPCDED